jgi:hypothetical protein
MVGDQLARTRGRLLDPVPLVGPGGSLSGWVVPVQIEGRLLGLIQLDEEDRFRRYASFMRRPGSIADCPMVSDWLDRSTILTRASALVAKGDRLGEPVLSFDRSPDRIVWDVPVVSPTGEGPRRIFVAGSHAYIPSEPTEPTTG